MPELVSAMFRTRAVALQDAAEEQADDHEDDGDLDQGEALLSACHGVFSRPVVYDGSGNAISVPYRGGGSGREG